MVPAVLILLFLVILPLNWKDQLILGLLLTIASLLLKSFFRQHRATILLMFVSCFCTSRYVYYRFSETAWNLRTSWSQIHALDLFFVLLLLAAEGYACLILYLGIFQTVRPLRRKPIQLPDDDLDWPTVDVFIPTYNEPLEVVKTTVLAALNLDWPAGRCRVCILDDGRRNDFAEFAEACGSGYITRFDNVHAKAGNINNAIKQTDADYIAIFDCDHIPTRSFLQMTMGWFLADARLAMLQTPHHFYSPDPFERNLGVFRSVPNEGALFYGIIQDGNDLWNATFFCGSYAVLRRSAIEEIGGVAVETVTEDAHTALRMQRNGWNTAYINLPQAAGLATARLSDHVGQRIRWARGMVQILRVDNPLFGPGLKLPQRLCYFNAMLHFLFAAPRLIFLTSPLVYLILGRYNVFGYLPAILAYAFPHLFISIAANSRVQGRHRHSFWNEIYEIVLAPYILLPTLLALVNPKWGKFNVTAKQSVIEGTFFDWRIARPFLILVVLNIIGLGMGLRQHWTQGGDLTGVLGINLFWAAFNIVLLGGALAVAQEQQQRRAEVRIAAKLPVKILLANGEEVGGRTVDLSNGGLLVHAARADILRKGELATVVLAIERKEFELPVHVVDSWGAEFRFQIGDLTLAQQAALTQVVFARADNWLDWEKTYRIDKPLLSLLSVLGISLRGLSLPIRAMFAKKPRAVPAPPSPKKPHLVAGSLLLIACLLPGRLLEGQPAPRLQPAAVERAAPGFQDQRNLTALGDKTSLILRGNGGRANVYFGIPLTKLVLNASLELRYRVSPGLLSGSSQINLILNASKVGTVPVAGSGESGNTAGRTEVALAPELFLSENTLTFELIGKCAAGCDESGDTGVWASIEPATELRTSGTLLPLANNLKFLPAPFLDTTARRVVDLPFVLDEHPPAEVLRAAGIVASGFGIKAAYRGIRFPVKAGQIPAGNVVFVGTNASPLAALLGMRASVPTVQILDNPNDPYGKVLAVVGEDEGQLLSAARAFALSAYTAEGDRADLTKLVLPPARQPYDAPLWLQTDRDVRLTQAVSDTDLQVVGGGVVNLYFRLPPDLYYGVRDMVPLHLRYRCSRVAKADKAVVTVQLNGNSVASRQVQIDSLTDLHDDIIMLPAADLYPRNTLSVDFSFDHVHLQSGAGEAPRAAVLRGTELLIRGISHFTEMPRLDLFATTGFPFTRMADLSETIVALPASPRPDELSLYLNLLGFMGAQTGYPALRVMVSEGGAPLRGTGKDILILGAYDDQPLLKQWADWMPIRPEGDQFRLAGSLGIVPVWELAPFAEASKVRRALDLLLQSGDAVDGMLQGFRSPLDPGRSVVSLSAPAGRKLDALADAWASAGGSVKVQGGISLLYGEEFRSYAVARDPYHWGQLGTWQSLQYWSRRYYWLIPVLVFGCIWFLTGMADRWLEARAAARLRLQN